MNVSGSLFELLVLQVAFVGFSKKEEDKHFFIKYQVSFGEEKVIIYA